ncbi:drebrin-like protein B [Emydura macquarii macquarii]|uniref:drebrin-like protein B n=1 Tax=Emydura macquarii macquarii TaxID=1129001 RepID=UPI00352A7577
MQRAPGSQTQRCPAAAPADRAPGTEDKPPWAHSCCSARPAAGAGCTELQGAIFAYEKHNELTLLDSGAGGADELAGKFSSGSVMYGLCRIRDPGSGQPCIVLINWVGEQVPESQRQTCAGHLPAVKAFFREAGLVLSARRPEEVTQEGLHRVLSRLAPAGGAVPGRVPASSSEELVGTNYRKTNPALEIRRTKRDSFWAQAEREEEQRKEAERRRLLEERKRWERERMEEEKREAAERERRFQEKERLIEEQRMEQARLEAEARRKEKARWEQQQREHEEAMRDRFRRSESLEKAVEAAVLVSQRSQNPREFFRQRERSGSASSAQPPPSPLGARPDGATPEASPAEPLPAAGHDGLTGQEAGGWLEPAEKADGRGGAQLQLQAAWDPAAGGTAWLSLQGGARQGALEGGGRRGPFPPHCIGAAGPRLPPWGTRGLSFTDRDSQLGVPPLPGPFQEPALPPSPPGSLRPPPLF